MVTGTYAFEYSGIATEATWGLSPIVNAASTAYMVGAFNDGFHPWYRTKPLYYNPAPTREFDTTVGVQEKTPLAQHRFAILDGVPLWYAMGESANVGAGAPYTHTLTFRDWHGGATYPKPPSFTWHRERTPDKATFHVLQVTGLRVQDFTLYCHSSGMGGNNLMMVEWGVIGKSSDDTVAYNLTTKPNSRITNADAYTFDMMATHNLAGAELKGILGYSISFQREVNAMFADAADSGANQSHLVDSHKVGNVSSAVLSVWYEPETYAYMENVVDDLSLVHTRAANDTITITGTNWHPERVDDPWIQPTDKMTPVMLSGPLEQLSITVVDSLAGATHYV